jgi:hypothetical protein
LLDEKSFCFPSRHVQSHPNATEWCTRGFQETRLLMKYRHQGLRYSKVSLEE